MSPYHMKIVYRTNIGVVIYLGLAWVFGRLSWPLVGFTFVFWLLLPFSVVWSWPEKKHGPYLVESSHRSSGRYECCMLGILWLRFSVLAD